MTNQIIDAADDGWGSQLDYCLNCGSPDDVVDGACGRCSKVEALPAGYFDAAEPDPIPQIQPGVALYFDAFRDGVIEFTARLTDDDAGERERQILRNRQLCRNEGLTWLLREERVRHRVHSRAYPGGLMEGGGYRAECLTCGWKGSIVRIKDHENISGYAIAIADQEGDLHIRQP